jgi:hypothetical protein
MAKNVWNFPGSYPTIAMTATIVSSAIWMMYRTTFNSPDVIILPSNRDEMYETSDAVRRGELFRKYSPYRFLASLASSWPEN